MPSLLADFIHPRVYKPICAKLLTLPKIANALCVSLDYLLIDCISAHYGLEGADDLFQNFIGETEEQLAREILIAIQHYLQRKE